MIRRPPRSTRTDTLFPYTTLFRSGIALRIPGATGDNMTDWYYHDPAQGRVGPLSAEQVRARYVDRRIQRDTLAWHAGAREWQPLDRFSDELQLDTLAPDASQPPPLPPAAPQTGRA